MTAENKSPKTIKDGDTGLYNKEVAILLDANCAIIYSMLTGWAKYNENNEQNFHDGRYWTYNSMRAWSLHLPFLTESQIRYALEKLEKAGLVVTGSYNKQPYDRTKWYSVNPVPQTKPIKTEDSIPENPQNHLINLSNETDKFIKPIPIINTIHNPTINQLKDSLPKKTEVPPSQEKEKTSNHQEIVNALAEATGMDKNISGNGARLGQLAKQLREAGYTLDDIQNFTLRWDKDWRAKGGSLPTLKIIREEIGGIKKPSQANGTVDKFRLAFMEQDQMKGS